MKVLKKPKKVSYTLPKPDPGLQDVLLAYNNSVIDVRNYTKETVYSAKDSSIIKKSVAQVGEKIEDIPQTPPNTSTNSFPLSDNADKIVVELPRVSLTEFGSMVTVQGTQVTLVPPSSQNKLKD